jgi:hypothetical protein
MCRVGHPATGLDGVAPVRGGVEADHRSGRGRDTAGEELRAGSAAIRIAAKGPRRCLIAARGCGARSHRRDAAPRLEAQPRCGWSDGDDRFHPESPCWDRCKIRRGGCQRRFPASTLHSWPPQPRPLMIRAPPQYLGATPAALDRQLPSAPTEGWTQRAGAMRQRDQTATRAQPLGFAVQRVLSMLGPQAVPQLSRKTGARCRLDSPPFPLHRRSARCHRNH